jgi:prepilin-type N-terminal cleavage/methylation domain-containing protein
MRARAGFSLIELLVALGILGILCIMILQSVASSAQLSGSVNTSNELLREGQITVQLLSHRLKEACYVHPSGTRITLTSTGFTATNAFNSANPSQWVIGTHPMVAMLLPPKPDETAYRFFAYYAIPRHQYVTQTTGASNPGRDALNDTSVWMLMEYRANIPLVPAETPCADIPTLQTYADSILGRAGNLVLDYLAPSAPGTQLFNIGPTRTLDESAQWIEYNVRMQRQTGNGNLVVIGDPNGAKLKERVYPHNLGL